MEKRNYILITPIKNEEKHILSVIDSVLEQTVKPKLWIIVNDNSTDNSLKIIEKKITGISWIKVITKEINKEYNWTGYVKVINEGINYCLINDLFNLLKIDYLGILDSDTVIDPNYFEKIIQSFLNDELLGVVSGKMYLKNKKRWCLKEKNKIMGPARMYRLVALKEIGFLKETPSPDTVSDIKIKNRGYKTRSLEGIRAFHYRSILEKDNSKLKGLFIFGRSRYILKAPIIFMIAISLKKSFTKKPFLLSGISFFMGYFTGYFTKEKRVNEKEVVIYWKNFWKRVLSSFKKSIFKKIKKHSLSKYWGFNLNNDYKNTILIIGSGRSGTTLLSNIINYNNDFRYLFEPFKDKRYGKIFRKKSLYIDSKDIDYKKYKTIRKILSGRVQSFWINRYNKKFFSKKRIIKDISIQFSLGYIRKNFPEIPVVILIRNPLAVVDSQVNRKWSFLNKSLENESFKILIEKYFKKNKKLIYNICKRGSTYERNTLLWSIKNYILLKQLVGTEFITFYENYIYSPEKEIRKLFFYLKINYNKKALSVLKEPFETSKDVPIKGERFLYKWKTKIPKEEIVKCKKIISNFGLDILYYNYEKPSGEGLLRVIREIKNDE